MLNTRISTKVTEGNLRIADFSPAEIQRPVREVKVVAPQLFLLKDKGK